MDFDPYDEWLKISTARRPPTHYDLLGLAAFEPDVELIRKAAMARSAEVRKYCLGDQGKMATRILGELAGAMGCLTNDERKSAYDSSLRESATLSDADWSTRTLSGAETAPRPIPVVPSPMPDETGEIKQSVSDRPRDGRWKRRVLRDRRRLVVAVAAGLVLVATCVLAGIIVSFKISDGVVVVEVNVKQPQVFIDGNTAVVTWKNGGKRAEIRVKPGAHQIKLSKDGFDAYGKKVIVNKGARRTISARLRPIKIESQPKPPADVAATPGPPATTDEPITSSPPSPTNAPEPQQAPRPSGAIAPFNAKQAREHQEAWAAHLGVPVEQKNSIGMRLVLVPPGQFMMGSTPEQIAEARKRGEQAKVKPDRWTLDRLQDEAPAHRVTISRPYLIGATETTVGEFRRFVDATNYVTETEQLGGGNSGSRREQNPNNKKITWRTPDHAITEKSNVSQLTWNDAVAFCNWLSAAERLVPCYRRVVDQGGWILSGSGTGYRLPTEAEWEYACRAGTTTQYSFSDDLAQFGQHGWSWTVAPLPRPLSVAAKLPNAFGIYDMHGNVYEWCHDWFMSGYYRQSPQIDPTGPPAGNTRVRRGGSSGFPLVVCRSAFRAPCPPVWRYQDLGFRVVRLSTAIADKE